MSDIFEATSDGIWVWDAEGRLIAINEWAEKYGGVKAENLIGKSHEELVSEGLYSRSAVPEIMAAKEQVSVESKSLKTGITTINTGSPTFDKQGNIVRVVVKEQKVTPLGDESKTRLVSEYLKDDHYQLGRLRLGREEIVAESEAYRHVLRMGFKLAESGVSGILILGDSGTGKGLLARLIHQMGARGQEPFIQVNCAAMPEELMEAELFGYESGAFTGAAKEGKPGLFELAGRGTIFLDEIGELPAKLQAKLLKCLDDFKVMRLGGTESVELRCNVIAATNRDLEKLVNQRKFREDLFFRINAFTLKVPPLRERPEDICGLVIRLLEKFNRDYGQTRKVSQGLIEQLQAYPFPGNIRELTNIMKRAVVLSDSDTLDQTILNIIDHEPEDQPVLTFKEKMSRYEKSLLTEAMANHSTTRAMAQYLGIDQSNVVRKMKKHGLSLKK